jgi:hypothetical protein
MTWDVIMCCLSGLPHTSQGAERYASMGEL